MMFRSITISFIAISICLINRATCAQEDYYWRAYSGSIPSDAVLGGKHEDGSEVYIGQAYVPNAGLIVAQINPGKKEVFAPYNTQGRKTNSYIKILCGPQENLYWLATNGTDLSSLLTNKQAVVGGHEDGNGPLYVGRTVYKNAIKIGKIDQFYKDAILYFNDEGHERGVEFYEILLYADSSNVDRKA